MREAVAIAPPLRIAHLTIVVPPLRERGDDVVLLAEHFLQKMAKEEGKRLREVGREVSALIKAHSWPGNVRELEKVIRRAVVMAPDDAVALALDNIQFGSALHPAGPMGSLRIAAAAGTPPRSKEAIAELTMDALLSNRIPLAGLRRGDNEIGVVAEAVVDGVIDGLKRYLASEAGEKALRAYPNNP